MGLARKMKNFLLFMNGVRYAGIVNEVTLPTLTRKMEAYRAGDMAGEVDVDLGQDKIEFEFMVGGWFKEARRQYGAQTVDAMQLRFAGAYQSDTDGRVQAVEVTVQGRIMEMEPGNAKAGDDTEQKFKISCVYYKEVVDGAVDVEVDFMNNILRSGGVDRNAEINSALGIDPLGGAVASITGGA